MTKKMILAALLALGTVPALATGAAPDPKASAAPRATDASRAMVGKEAIAQDKAETTSARACACSHRGGNPESIIYERPRAGGQR